MQPRDSFERLSDNHQGRLLDLIGELACARASQQEGGGAKSGCSSTQCVTQLYAHGVKSETPKRLSADVQDLITAVIEVLPHLQKLTRTRVAAMRTVQRLLAHTNDPEHLNMRIAVLGHWCLQAVHSSLRDLRIVAGYRVHFHLGFCHMLIHVSQPDSNGVSELSNCIGDHQGQSQSGNGEVKGIFQQV